MAHRPHSQQQLALALWVIAEHQPAEEAAEAGRGGGESWGRGLGGEGAIRKELVACRASASLDPRSVRCVYASVY